jgi:hypothetical protein
MIRFIAIAGINFYRKHLSHRKGFKCAHNGLHKNGSCSTRILSIVKESKLSQWRNLIKQQFSSCRSANITLQKINDNKKKNKCLPDAFEEGMDCGFDNCDGGCDGGFGDCG